jgi:hypothetical protein
MDENWWSVVAYGTNTVKVAGNRVVLISRKPANPTSVGCQNHGMILTMEQSYAVDLPRMCQSG